MADADETGTHASGQRLDKWLWFARVIKSRTLATGLVTDGKVRVNRQRVDKPSLTVRPGDVITVTVRGAVRVLKVAAPGLRGGPPTEAQTLYQEITVAAPPSARSGADPSPPAANSIDRGGPIGQRPAGSGRPTKRDRRQLTRLTDSD